MTASRRIFYVENVMDIDRFEKDVMKVPGEMTIPLRSQ